MDDSEATPTQSPAADPAAIDVAHLIKVYKTTRAVDDVSFRIRRGSITGLLGGNGAGKTHHPPSSTSAGEIPAGRERLLFDNGLGGFTPDGREYVISLRGGERPPAPWSNVLANPDFGCLVTESGGGYTWAGNSQMNRLTTWRSIGVRA